MLKTIRHESKGDIVKVAQYLTGYARLKEASGEFDAHFVSHVTAWQRTNKLTPDGIIGPNTWAMIVKKAPMCSTSKNKTSAATCALQILLDGPVPDGIFGSQTKKAVAAYQSAKGLAADGICGPKTWAALITGEAETAAKPSATPGVFVQPKDFKQYDSKWGNKVYTSVGNNSQTMRNSGCGPTAAANVVATLKDSGVTPWTLAQIALKKGYRTANSGTAWAFFKHLASVYGFSKFVQTSGLSTLKACLDAGGYVVCSMGPGYWTKGGHYITAWKYDGGYIYCNDPASATRKKQKEADFVKQRKQFFCFWP